MSQFLSAVNRFLAQARFGWLGGNNLRLEEGVHWASPWQSHVSCPTLVGRFTRINGPITIRGEGRVTIGRYGAIAPNLMILVSNHDMRMANLQIEFQRRYGFGPLVSKKGEVTIGHGVWIGEAVTLLNGASIGDGAVIGARSVVTHDVPPFSIAVGVPARVIRARFSEAIIAQLAEIKWWEWPEEKIERNKEFFTRDLTAEPELDLWRIIV